MATTRAEKEKATIELYNSEVNKLTKSISNWKDFLSSSVNFYKHSFANQVLIKAQKPDATAMATFGDWDTKMDRQIKYRTKGTPALYFDKNNEPKLTYLYDVSDTVKRTENSKEPNIWKIDRNYEDNIVKNLSKKFDINSVDMSDFIDTRVKNLVEENYKDYFSEIIKNKENSFLEELDDNTIEVNLKFTLQESTRYALYLRCNLDTSEFDDDSFRGIADYNTNTIIEQLGKAINKFGKNILRDIEREVKTITDNMLSNQLNIDDIESERSNKNERSRERENNLGGRFGTSRREQSRPIGRMGDADNGRSESREDTSRPIGTSMVRGRTEVLSEMDRNGNGTDDNVQRGIYLSSANGYSRNREETLRNGNMEQSQNEVFRNGETDTIRDNNGGIATESTSNGHGYESNRNGTGTYGETESRERSDGTAQSGQSDRMAEQNEQYTQTGGRNDLQGTDLQINNNDEKAVTENNGAAFSDFVQTIEMEKYSAPDEKGRVKLIGMATLGEVYEQLEKHLKENDMLPDEYFMKDLNFDKDMEVPEYAQFVCHPYWGSSEGIYLDITMETANGVINFAVGKTLGEDYAAFKRMGDIATECNLMLNSNGMRLERTRPKEKQLTYHISADGTAQSVQIGHKSDEPNLQNQQNEETLLKNDSEQPKNNIIGNTAFKHIKKKAYHKNDTETAMRIAAEFDKSDIKYSGKINDNGTVTLTYSGLDANKVTPIIEAVKNAVKEERNKKGFTEEEIELARKVNLVDYLQNRGVQLKQVGREYTMPEHDSMRIRDNKFFWNSQNTGGNAVDFCMDYFKMDFNSAVGELLDFSGYRKENTEIKGNITPVSAQSERRETEEEHKPLPYPLDTQTNRVYAYLTKTRGIDADIVNRFIKDGSIGQDERGNAVFKTFGEQGELSGAEINSTLSNYRFKQTTERNGNGFTIIPNPDIQPKSIIFFESAIDTLSYYNLAKRNNNRNIDNYMLVSMGGLKDKVINETLQKYEKQFGKKMECILSTDNDDAGINFAKKFEYKFHSVADTTAYKNHTGKKIKDWNDLLQAENERISAEKETSETEIKNVFEIAKESESNTANKEISEENVNNTINNDVAEENTNDKSSDVLSAIENMVNHINDLGHKITDLSKDKKDVQPYWNRLAEVIGFISENISKDSMDSVKEYINILENTVKKENPELNHELKVDGNTISIEEISKEKEKTSFVNLYRYGDFYEAFNEEAVAMANALNLHTTKNAKGDIIVGIPQHILDTDVELLKNANIEVNIFEHRRDIDERNTEITSKESNEDNNISDKKISPNDVKIGDIFLLNGEKVTVSSMQGIYPDDVGISKKSRASNGMEYVVTENIDKFRLINDAEYLGNRVEIFIREHIIYEQGVQIEHKSDDENNGTQIEHKLSTEKSVFQKAFEDVRINHNFHNLSNDANILLERIQKTMENSDITIFKDDLFNQGALRNVYGNAERVNEKYFNGELSSIQNEINLALNENTIQQIIDRTSSDLSVINAVGNSDRENTETEVKEKIKQIMNDMLSENTTEFADFCNYFFDKLPENTEIIDNIISIAARNLEDIQRTMADDPYIDVPQEDISENQGVQIEHKSDDIQIADNNTLERAKQVINDFCTTEFDSNADFTDLHNVNIAYTTLTDYELPVQISVDLVDNKIKHDFDGEIFETEQYDSLADMIENGLTGLDFSELVYVPQDIQDNHTRELSANENQGVQIEHKSEITSSKPTNFHITDNNLGIGTAKEKYENNINAIKTLQKIEKENRAATAEEQETLSKYVGWGGLADAFDNSKTAWTKEYNELKNLLSPYEYNAARASTLNAHYTAPMIINAMYDKLSDMGFKGGKVLEPAMGIGNFFGAMPKDLQDNSKLYGVELDSVSGRIAKHLYPDANIQINGFETVNPKSNSFDVAIGNVPFGNYRLYDNDFKKGELIHDYFFKKSLDKVKPNGIVAFITSKGTMDKQDNSVRKYLAERADLLGAVRLPNTAFKANAGTEVVSDIIFLQKRENIRDFEKEQMPDWVNVSEIDKSLYTDKALENDSKIFINDYFKNNPEMVAGDLKVVSSQYGFDITCDPKENADLSDVIKASLSKINGTVTSDIAQEEISLEENITENKDIIPENYRNYCYHIIDNDIYFRENDEMKKQSIAGKNFERLKGMVEISSVLQELIQYQRENRTDGDITAKQEELNTVYDAFTKKYGLLNDRQNKRIFKGDDTAPLISSLENINEKGELTSKADIFTKRTIVPYIPVTSVQTASEALAVSISEKAKVDLDFMSKLCSKTKDEVIDDLKGVIFKNPKTERYETADEYLSGNVRDKLQIAKDYAQTDSTYNVNVEHLTAVQPVDLKPEEIEAQLGSTWIPTKYFEQFMYELLETPQRCHSDNYFYKDKNPFASTKSGNNVTITVAYDELTATYGISNKSSFYADRDSIKAIQTYGTSRKNAYAIIEDALNMKPEKIYDYIDMPDGKTVARLNEKETLLAQEKQDEIKQRFKEWVFSDFDRTTDLCKIYNEKFNSTRPREYDGSHITFGGINPEIKLRTHQVNAIAHTLYGGNTLLAHSVGAGKTFEMVASAMESKRLGLCSKSLICVPKHILNQVAREFLQLYPTANILVPDEKDFSKENRQRFCARIATGNYDAIILSHNQFEKIPLSAERQANYIDEEINSITTELDKLRENSTGKGFTIKQLEQTRKTLESKLERLNNNEKRDSTICFEDLGVDKLYVDEAHTYKNKFFATKIGRNISGINASSVSQRATDLDMKCRYLDEITGNKGLCFATGTPLSNSMTELYTMQSYLQREGLKEKGLDHFDAWASTFGEIKLAMELSPEGTGFQLKNRFANFFNLPELITMFKEIADIKTPDVLNLPVPKANYHNVAVESSETQKEMVADLAVRADNIRKRRVTSNEDNMLNITNDGRKLALDQRLLDPTLPDFPDSKVNVCINNVFSIWESTSQDKLTQMIFCDLSTPHYDGKFNVYDDIKQKLVEKGVPENEIAFIHDCKTDEQKQALFTKVQNGDVRVLLGSTQKMGTGTNCQKLLKAVHHIDCPYRPADLEQRNGRIIRQGNQNKEVDIFNYVTKNTFDSYLYQLVENKQKFVSQIMTSKSPVRRAEDIDENGLNYAQLKALASGNPKIERKMNLEVEVARLKTLFSAHQENNRNLQYLINRKLPEDIDRFTKSIENCKTDVAQASATKSEEFVGMTVGEKFYADKKEAGEALLDAINKLSPTAAVDGLNIGKYRGFDIDVSYSTLTNMYSYKIKNADSYEISFGTDTYGNIKRLDNQIDNYISEKLPKYENSLAKAKTQLETAKANVDKPFEKMEEYESKEKELRELNKEFASESFDNKDVPADEQTTDKKKDSMCI